jgi:DNA-binding MarR family transcriptional regulator/GNAT superfamily N-acetyltransferase
MNSLHDYGPLLLGSRLRKVSETMFAGVDEIYRERGVPLPSRCFPILFLLRDLGRLGISELAERLGQTHPAVSQMSRKLLAHGVVREWPDPADERRRLLSLSPRGTALMKRLEPTWAALVAAVAELESEHGLSTALTAVDGALQQRDFASRIRQQMQRAAAAPVEILPFERRYGRDFKRLNLEWLRRYFKVEPVDEVVLSDPEALLRAGGHIFLARLHGRIVGTCGLLVSDDGAMELSKMAVTASCQGLGIGRRLMEAALGCFHELGSRRLYLETNSILSPAIALYESVGFRHEPRPGGPSHYERADVYMVYYRPGVRAPRKLVAGQGLMPAK